MGFSVFPLEVMFIILTYATRHAARIAATCKTFREFTKTKQFWERGVRAALAERLAGRIHPQQLAAMDVFFDGSNDLRQRVGWMFNSVLSRMESVYQLIRPRTTWYHDFMIWNRDTGEGVHWSWSLVHLDDFGVTRGRWETTGLPNRYSNSLLVKTTLYPLHATVRGDSVYADRSGIDYTIYDPARNRTWVGPGVFSIDAATGRINITPKEEVISYPGQWLDGDVGLEMATR